ncbi:hypothetical protein V6U90_19230 [Micromonospora sp. CPCC 206060]|uniref:hypothetical protein n=1 Tax=Micromonospora sp. CPCC 206060 TaxID=3122406 RepID=UPI002FF271C4
MAVDKSDDLRPAGWTPITELPGGGLFDRLDFGDATRHAECEDADHSWPDGALVLADADSSGTDEPLQLVDAPVEVGPPATGRRRGNRSGAGQRN